MWVEGAEAHGVHPGGGGGQRGGARALRVAQVQQRPRVQDGVAARGVRGVVVVPDAFVERTPQGQIQVFLWVGGLVRRGAGEGRGDLGRAMTWGRGGWGVEVSGWGDKGERIVGRGLRG